MGGQGGRRDPPDELDATHRIAKGANPATAPFASVDLEPGARVDHYVVEGQRGGGGFATVYRARDERDGRPVALKVLHSFLARTPSIRRRFEREAEMIAHLTHPNIVRLLGYGEVSDGNPYLAMEWIDGPTLAELLRDHGPLAPDEALPILEALASALGAAHAAGVIHRDLNVANVAIADGVVKLLDFGIAKMLEPEESGAGFTTAGTKIGTPHYMAPEQVLGRTIDQRVDVYAFGILIFELLTRRRPFDGRDLAEVEEKQLREPPPAASRFAPISAQADAVIRHAMEKDPEKRPASTGDVLAALRAALAGRAAPAAPVRRRGIAIYLQGAIRDELIADAALDQLDSALERARREAGLDVATATGNALLLVGVDEPELLPRVETLARDIAATATHPDLELAVTVHVDDIDVIDEPGGQRYVGGPLLDVKTWVRDEAGVHITPQARR